MSEQERELAKERLAKAAERIFDLIQAELEELGLLDDENTKAFFYLDSAQPPDSDDDYEPINMFVSRGTDGTLDGIALLAEAVYYLSRQVRGDMGDFLDQLRDMP